VDVEKIGLPNEHCQDGHGQQAGAEPGPMPVRQRGDTGHECRRRGPPQVAAQTVCGERVAEPLHRNAAVQDGEIDRVEHAVAQPRQARAHGKHPVVTGQRQREPRQRQHRDPEQQNRARTDAVHGEACQRLTDAGNNEKDRHQRANLGEVEAEVLHQPGEQRRKEQVEEVRGPVSKPDHADDADVAAGLGIVEQWGHGTISAVDRNVIVAFHCLAGLRYRVE
jgi:hypothetical protein